MTKSFCDNLSYLATKVHARRSRMQEGKRLDALCHIHTLHELTRAVGLDGDFPTAVDFQRRLAQDLIHELAGFTKHISETKADVFFCLLRRFEIENVKMVLRGLINKIPQNELRSHLISLPAGMTLDAQKLMNAGSFEDFATLLPPQPPYRRLRDAIFLQRQPAIPFFLEMALDSDYFQELVSKTRQLPEDDLADICPLMLQEANLFQFMLVIRGKFLYRLPPESLLPLRVTGVSDAWFKELLAVPDMLTAAKSGVGTVLDELPTGRSSGENTVNPAVLETLAWNRYARLANMAFRRGNIGLGAVIGYAGLRRVETANLITLSEGIRMGVRNDELRQSLTARTNPEAVHV